MPPTPKPPILPLIWLVFAGLMAVTGLALFGSDSGGGGSEVIPYSEFQSYLDAGKVKQVTIAGDVITGTLIDALPNGKTAFSTVDVRADLAGELAKHHVEFSATASDKAVGQVLSWIIPPLLFVGLWLLASRAMTGGAGGRGGLHSRAEVPAAGLRYAALLPRRGRCRSHQ